MAYTTACSVQAVIMFEQVLVAKLNGDLM